MNCRSATTLFSAFLEDELNQRERRSLESHLLSCRRCSVELRELRATLELIPNVPVFDTSPHFEEDLLSRVRSGEAMRPSVIEWVRSLLVPDRLRPAFLVGAAACAVWIGAVMFGQTDMARSLLGKEVPVASTTGVSGAAPKALVTPGAESPDAPSTGLASAGTAIPSSGELTPARPSARAVKPATGYAWAERAWPATTVTDSVIPNPGSRYDDQYITDQFYLNRTSNGSSNPTVTPVSDQASDDAYIIF